MGGHIGVASHFLGRYREFDNCLNDVLMPQGSTREFYLGMDACNHYNDMVRYIRARGMEWLWILGDDHVFVPDLLVKLLDRNVDIVVPLCLDRINFRPILHGGESDRFVSIGNSWAEIEGKSGLMEWAGTAGNAGMLIRARVFDKIEEPWFRAGQIDPEYSGSDIYFCHIAQKAGFKVYVDLDNCIGHINHMAIWPHRGSDGVWFVDIRMAGANKQANLEARRVYYCEGMKFFGERMTKYCGYQRYNPLTDIHNPTIFEGLYFQEDYDIFMAHKGNRIVFWNGSDVLRLLVNPEWQKILQSTPARHYCQNKDRQEKLEIVGIKATIHPIFFGDMNKYPISYQQSDHPQVYMNAHPGREEEYGVPLALGIAKEATEVRFHIYGIEGKDTENVFYHGWVDEEVMDSQIKDFQACLRLLNGEGFSQTLVKSGLMGQYPISTRPIDGAWYAPDGKKIMDCLMLLKSQTEPNYKLRANILALYENSWVL